MKRHTEEELETITRAPPNSLAYSLASELLALRRELRRAEGLNDRTVEAIREAMGLTKISSQLFWDTRK